MYKAIHSMHKSRVVGAPLRRRDLSDLVSPRTTSVFVTRHDASSGSQQQQQQQQQHKQPQFRSFARSVAVYKPSPIHSSLSSSSSSSSHSKSKSKSNFPISPSHASANANANANASTVAFHGTQDSPNEETETTETPKKERSPIPDFNDAQAAFESKSSIELLRAAFTFGLCQIPPIVKHSETLLHMTRSVAGDRITDGFLKATLFGHFCAGEDEAGIKPSISNLEKVGIGSILDYAAEDDGECVGANPNPATEGFGPHQMLEHTFAKARMYDYESEAKCDRHLEDFKKCIHSVSNLQKDGFAAIKLTALGNPKLLARMSRAIVEAQNLFSKFDTGGKGYISQEEFERGLDMFFVDNEDTMQFKKRVKELMPTNVYGTSFNCGQVDYITWSMLLAPSDLPKITSGCREVGPLALATPTEEEAELIEKMYERGHDLAKEAAACGVRLLVDAEQTRFQPAIDNLVLDLQRTYNAATETDIPIIYNTYQCYLKDAGERLRADVERSKRYSYHFGTKLVRGAYMESERALAESLDLPSPILDTLQETHDCYNDLVKYLLEYSQESKQAVELMCATHNQETIQLAIEVMNDLGIDRRAQTISFAQLYGMMDNVTFNLGKHGFRAYKYLPYGEVKMVMPYLIRRANENSSVADGASKELKMIVKELSRRMVSRRQSQSS